MTNEQEPRHTPVDHQLSHLYEEGFETEDILTIMAAAPGMEKHLQAFITKYNERMYPEMV